MTPAAEPSVLAILAAVTRAGVSVALTGDGRLVVQAAPMGAVPPAVRALVVSRREALVDGLRRRSSRQGDRPAIRAWLCVQCQERYPASGQRERLCAACGAIRRHHHELGERDNLSHVQWDNCPMDHTADTAGGCAFPAGAGEATA